MDTHDIVQIIETATPALALRIKLANGQSHIVYNVAVGCDMGTDDYHITTNISPEVEGAGIDFFHTSEIDEVHSLADGKLLYSRIADRR